MSNLLHYLSTARDLALVILGFGLIVFLHELGHFIAARWAGIRVLAFAIGFGPAAASFRKGMGLRLGSGEKEYLSLLKTDPAGAASISPTEYRFNVLPLGGYVKMLGQEDANPDAVSDAPDSYQNCKPWKRMVVISAGVFMNIVTAAVLFIAVFMIGLKDEPAKVGSVIPGTASAMVMPTNAADAGVTTPGLLPGDELLKIDDRKPNSFKDLILATAMAKRGEDVQLTVRRPGVALPLHFALRPEPGRLTGLLELGVGPSQAAELLEAKTDEDRSLLADLMEKAGLKGVESGMKLVRVGNDTTSPSGNTFTEASRRSNGVPFEVEFKGVDGKSVTGLVKPTPMLELDHAPRPGDQVAAVEHLLGLTPLMRVVDTSPVAAEQGLRPGDVFVRIADVEYPSVVQGMAEIKAHKGKTIAIDVLRTENGQEKLVSLPDVNVNSRGEIGFHVADTKSTSAQVSLPPELLRHPGVKDPKESFKPAASGVIISPGTRIVSIGGLAVSNFADIRAALLETTKNAENGATVTLKVRRPVEGRVAPDAFVESVEWKLAQEDITRIRSLGWEGPVVPFETESFIRKARTPGEAIDMGLAETRRVMLSTYVTFARLAQGTVKVEHLKGPVGIAHMGTIIAGRGATWLLFFMALISVNLAVINFMPLPIVDGGQFLFLVYEQIRGKPVPLGVQNAVTMAGLILIGSMFLIVTYNDILHLFGR